MSDNNSSGKFVSADTTKIANFEKQRGYYRICHYKKRV